MSKYGTTNKKQQAARIVCSLVLGTYLVGGYGEPVAWGAAAEQNASNVASYSLKWGEAIGTGVLADGNKELITGGTVWAKTSVIDETLKLISDATNELAWLTSGFPDSKTIKQTMDETGGNLITYVDGESAKLDEKVGAAADAIAASSDRIKALEDADFQGQIDDTQTYVNGEFAKLDEKVGAAADAIAASSDRIKALEDADFQGQIDELKAGTGTGLAEVNHRIDNVDSKINKVGAGAAALAALHPMDTDNKFTMAAGFGNYRDANAMALGVFYRPNDQVMFSMGGSLGNGENLLNVGVSFALDKGVTTSKAAMARTIKAQGEEIQSLRAENAKLAERLAAIEAKLGK